MHTTVIRQREQGGAVAPGDVRIHHNGDWSGDAEVQWSNEDRGVVRATIPGWVAEALVAAEEPVYAGQLPETAGDRATIELLREINRAAAKMPTPSEMTAAASEHPAPWRWRDDDPGLPLCVVDARGRFMFAVDLGERIPSPGERDLIAAAPEMAALLRAKEFDLPGARTDTLARVCSLCFRTREEGHLEDCALGRVLARLPREVA